MPLSSEGSPVNDLKTPQNVLYQIRHRLAFNVADPLSEESRGYAEYSQYFSGTNTIGQVNYFERKCKTGTVPLVQVGGVTKTATSDYTYSNTTGQLTWVTAAASGNDNIVVTYTSVIPWIYDDHPNANASNFPRMTVLDVTTDKEDTGMGIYTNYDSNIGQWNTRRIKVITRHRKNNNFYVYGNIHYKNYDLVSAISEEAEHYFNTHKIPMPWKFWDWKVIRNERQFAEEDTGILRCDLTLDVKYTRGDV